MPNYTLICYKVLHGNPSPQSAPQKSNKIYVDFVKKQVYNKMRWSHADGSLRKVLYIMYAVMLEVKL